MDEAVVEQEIERPIDRDRGRALARRRRDFFDHVIGAERPAFAGENFENEAAARRQFDAMRMAQLLRRGERALDGGIAAPCALRSFRCAA